MDFFIVQSQYDSLHLDSYFDMNPVQINSLSEIESIFNFPRYMKGKNNLIEKYSITINISIVVLVILRMFRNAITDETFRRNIQTYLHTQ